MSVCTCGRVSLCVVGEGSQCYSNIHTGDTGTLHFQHCSLCDHEDAADVFAPSIAQLQSTWNNRHTHCLVLRLCSMVCVRVSAVFHLCQQLACMMCPQLAVWIPRDRSGCMNRGSRRSKTYSHASESTPTLIGCCSDDIMMLYSPGSGRVRWRFLDRTVDLWTNAANTIALPWPLTSCSSWHRIQVTGSRRSAPPIRRGPTHICETDDGSELGVLEERREKGNRENYLWSHHHLLWHHQNLEVTGSGHRWLGVVLCASAPSRCVHLAHAAADVEASSSSRLCWNSSLFSLMKCFCISDIWAMIFSLLSRAISAFLFLSALSLSLTICRDPNRPVSEVIDDRLP